MELRSPEFFTSYSQARAPHLSRDYNGGVDFVLRNFRRPDFETLWSIDQVCFAAGIAYSRQELSLYLRHPRSFTLVATLVPESLLAESVSSGGKPPGSVGANGSDTDILGFLVAETHRSTGHVITIDVLPRAQRAGVGSKLLAAAEERLHSASCRRIYLETAVDNLPAIAFYKRHRYFAVRTLPKYYANGVDALMMEKDLLSAGQAS